MYSCHPNKKEKVTWMAGEERKASTRYWTASLPENEKVSGGRARGGRLSVQQAPARVADPAPSSKLGFGQAASATSYRTDPGSGSQERAFA